MKRSLKLLYNDTLFRNSVYLMLSTGTMSVFGFVFWLIVAHHYRPDQIGIASTLISSLNFIKYFSLLGFESTFIRFLAKSKHKSEQIDTGLLLVAASAFIASGIYVLLAPHFAPQLGFLHQQFLLAGSFIVIGVATTLNLLTDSIFVAYRSAGYNTLIDGLIGSGFQLLLPVFLISLGAYGIFAAQGAASGVALIGSIIFLVKKFGYRPNLKLSRTVLREVVHYSSINYVASLFNTVPVIVLPIIILNKLGAAAAGYYYLAFMMANLLYTVVYAVAQSFFAEGSFGEQRLLLLAKRAALFMGIIIVPAALLFVAIGPVILDAFGKTYGEHGRRLLILLAAAAPFLAASAIGSIIMRITKRTLALIGINIASAAALCGLTLLWADKGLPWVAGAWLSGQAVAAVITYAVLIWELRTQRAIARMPA